MPLANIFRAPAPAMQRAYDFSHWLDHLEIVRAINKGALLGFYEFTNSTLGVIHFTNSTSGVIVWGGTGSVITGGKALPTYPIFPVLQSAPQRTASEWQRQHQAFHNDMNLALKLPQGRDLIGEMTSDWYYRNWQEHQAARSKLGI